MATIRRVILHTLLSTALLGACAAPLKGDVRFSGFLGDYSGFTKGGRGEVAMVQRRTGHHLAEYDRIMLDPLTVWYSPDAEYRGIHPEHLKALADYFETTVRDALGDAYPVVTEPEPGVLRIRAAITGVKPSRPLLDAATNVPPARLADLASAVILRDHLFVGEAAIEAEFLDSVTGERVVAIIDSRGGAKTPLGVHDRWADAKGAFDYWARMLRRRLDDAHGG